jgi:ureidoglycolate hydrolase
MSALTLEPLTSESFGPFGKVLSKPAAAAQAEGAGWSWWAEIAALPADGRRWAFGYLTLEPVPLTIDWAERHLRSPEVVLASSADVAVYVAPSGTDEPSLSALRAFRVPAGAGVVLDTGVWHGAPFTLDGRTSAFVLLLEGTGRDDVTVVRFPDTPVSVDADSSASYRGLTQVKG